MQEMEIGQEMGTQTPKTCQLLTFAAAKNAATISRTRGVVAA